MDYNDFKKQVKSVIGIDLNSYKEQQMHRRIRQWISRHRLGTWEDLIHQIQSDPEHQRQFCEYLTINTSHFFRDANVFSSLKREVLPTITKDKRAKIWSAGCSIGAEVYSLVMLLLDLKLSFSPILATDIDEVIIGRAKAGVYHPNQLEAVPKEYLQRYFAIRGDQYVLAEAVKRHVKFSQHNLLKDSYGKEFDLILCRNVFIYFTSEVQRQLIANFVKALLPNGFFVVGSAEQIMNPRLFGLRRVEHCIYQKGGV